MNEAKEYKLGGNTVKKGQQVKIKHPIDAGKELVVKYVGPHESNKYFYCMDDTDRLKAFQVADVIEIVAGEDKKKRKASVESIKSQKDKISNLEANLATLMSDMENDPAVLKELEAGGGEATDNYGRQIGALQAKINNEYNKLRKMQEGLDVDVAEEVLVEGKGAGEYVRIMTSELEGASDLENSIRLIGQRDNIYVDEATGGVKVKITKDSKIESLVELLTEFANGYKDKEDEKLKAIYDAISKIEETFESETEKSEDQNKDDTKEDSKKEDDKKAEEE